MQTKTLDHVTKTAAFNMWPVIRCVYVCVCVSYTHCVASLNYCKMSIPTEAGPSLADNRYKAYDSEIERRASWKRARSRRGRGRGKQEAPGNSLQWTGSKFVKWQKTRDKLLQIYFPKICFLMRCVARDKTSHVGVARECYLNKNCAKYDSRPHVRVRMCECVRVCVWVAYVTQLRKADPCNMQ